VTTAAAYAAFMGAGWRSLEIRLKYGAGSPEHKTAREEVERLKAEWVELLDEEEGVAKNGSRVACLICEATFASIEAMERHENKRHPALVARWCSGGCGLNLNAVDFNDLANGSTCMACAEDMEERRLAERERAVGDVLNTKEED
jgi:hypothetical protein